MKSPIKCLALPLLIVVGRLAAQPPASLENRFQRLENELGALREENSSSAPRSCRPS